MPVTTHATTRRRLLARLHFRRIVRIRRSSPTPPQPDPARCLGVRKKLFRIRPSAHLLAGVAVLALAAGGAIARMQGTQQATGRNLKPSMQARLLDSPTTGRSSDARSNRQSRVSRDFEREPVEGTAEAFPEAPTDVQVLKRSAALAAQKRAAQKRAAQKRAAEKRAAAWQSPLVRGTYALTGRFGQCSGLWSHCHTGLDFAAPTGTPIRSVAAATVRKVGYAGAYGIRTIVTLDDGTQVWYCHQNNTSVAPGQRVRRGDRIGAVGATGNVTGPHLHLEVRPRGRAPVDPRTALIAHNVHP